MVQQVTSVPSASVLGVESLAGGFRLLLVAVGTARGEVVVLLGEKGSVAVNHINRIKIHLEHK